MSKDIRQREEEVITDLAAAMRFKFTVHRHKGSWGHKSLDQLTEEWCREVAELKEAISQLGKEHIISEIGDVANYLAMMLDKVQGD